MTQKQPSQAIKLVYLLGILFGLGIVGWEGFQLHQQKASLLWPVARGKILDSQLIYVSGRHSSYRVDVTYNYFANGTRQISHQISLWSPDLRSESGIARMFVANHTNGSPVDVYYDPTNPENAVLIPGADEKSSWLLMSMGGFSAFAGILGFIARLRKEPRLRALLNDPAAETRTISLNKADIIRGTSAFALSFLFGGFTFIFSAVFVLVPLFSGPANLPGSSATQPWRWAVAAGGIVAACLIVRRGMRQARCAECPYCHNFLNKTTFTTGRCDGCGTRIIFDGIPAPTAAHTQPPRPTITRGFQKDRFTDVAGFMAFPILFAWLFGAFDPRTGPAPAVLMTILFSMLGGLYYFCPQPISNKPTPTTGKEKAKETEEKTGPHWLDFGIILSPPAVLLSYLLYLVWSGQTLDTRGLVVIVIAFPLGLVAITYICKYRFIRDQKSDAPKPPAFVPMTLLALWLAGTFISVLFFACLILKLVAHK